GDGAAPSGSPLTITFRGTDLTLLLGPPAGDTAQRLYVTVDGGTSAVAPNLPRDAAGLPYIDASAGTLLAPGDPQAGGPLSALTGTRAVRLVAGLGSEMVPAVHQVQVRAA